jgi:VWFA-related protein
MRHDRAAAAALAACLVLSGAGRPAAQTIIRTSVELVTVDLVVRDRSGSLISGLSAEDFQVLEDGVPQRVAMFDALDARQSAPASAQARTSARATRVAGPSPQAEPRGVMVLAFDLAGLGPDDLDRAISAARRYAQDGWPADVVMGAATIGSGVEWLIEPTSDRAQLAVALDQITAGQAVAVESPVPRTLAIDEAAGVPIDGELNTGSGDSALLAAAPDDVAVLTNDTRLRSLTRLAGQLERFGRKKALLYFSGGLDDASLDNQVEMRAAVNAAVRANVAIYPVDTGGLQTMVPGGDATRGSVPGQDLFSGGDVSRQIEDLAGSQESLVTLAADTGGRAYLDTNDFSVAFTRAAGDLSTYYLLGYQSTNPVRDGRFRRIQVRVGRPGLRVETRAGYYADLDFAHAASADREAQLTAELSAPLSSTDLPVAVNFAWFRVSAGEYTVPLAIAIPGWDVQPPPDAATVPVDVIGEIRDEDRRSVSRFRQTASIPRGTEASLARSLLVYRLTARLPPGRFQLKVVVRENLGGRIGSYEAPLVVPDLSRRPLEASALILRTADAPPASPPWSPHPTQVVGRDQPFWLMVEIYDPALSRSGLASVRAGLRCFRDHRVAFETPLEAREGLDRRRQALPIVIEVPRATVDAGLHTCQITVIDDVAKRFVFPRVTFAVR